MNTSESYLVPVGFSIVISLTWFIYNLKLYKLVPHIEDRKRILLPSAFTILAPFILTYLFVNLNKDMADLLKSALPILTFYLGQLSSHSQRKKEDERQAKKIIRAVVYFIGIEVIKGLSNIENQIIQYAFGKTDRLEIENYVQAFLSTINKEYESLIHNETLAENDSGMIATLYIRKVGDILNGFSVSDDVSDFYSIMLKLSKLKLEGCFYVSSLIQNHLESDKLLIDSWIFYLKSERNNVRSRLSKLNLREVEVATSEADMNVLVYMSVESMETYLSSLIQRLSSGSKVMPEITP